MLTLIKRSNEYRQIRPCLKSPKADEIWEEGPYNFVTFSLKRADGVSSLNETGQPLVIFVVDRFQQTLLEAKTIVPNETLTQAQATDLKQLNEIYLMPLPAEWRRVE